MRMRIGGLQKVTLLDYPGKVACTVFLPGCNLRCPFCHNPALVLPDRATGGLSTEELIAFLETRRGKLDGVCVTGGEPTLYEDLPAMLRQIRALGFAVKLDTNGTNPDMLEALAQEGLLDYAAMDIKNSPDRYTETCGGVDLLGPVKRSAALLMAAPWTMSSAPPSAHRCTHRRRWPGSAVGSRVRSAISFNPLWTPANWWAAA